MHEPFTLRQVSLLWVYPEEPGRRGGETPSVALAFALIQVYGGTLSPESEPSKTLSSETESSNTLNRSPQDPAPRSRTSQHPKHRTPTPKDPKPRIRIPQDPKPRIRTHQTSRLQPLTSRCTGGGGGAPWRSSVRSCLQKRLPQLWGVIQKWLPPLWRTIQKLHPQLWGTRGRSRTSRSSSASPRRYHARVLRGVNSFKTATGGGFDFWKSLP